jgi:hypothetical protein
MGSHELELSVWTEGLGEFWGIQPEQRERRRRDDMAPEQLADIIHAILEENNHDANGLFILASGDRRLNLALSNGVIEISDPQNLNYQNVALAEAELIAFLNDFFARPAEEEEAPLLRTPLVQKVEYAVAIISIVALALTLKFVVGYLNRSSEFMPEVEAVEITDPTESRQLVVKYSGIYATSMDDGEMVLEIQDDGKWHFYDMQSSTLGSFILNMVKGGNFRPVVNLGRPAILTDTRYLFYPSNAEKTLHFLNRPFKRIGNTRDDLPYLSFPEDSNGTLAKL